MLIELSYERQNCPLLSCLHGNIFFVSSIAMVNSCRTKVDKHVNALLSLLSGFQLYTLSSGTIASLYRTGKHTIIIFFKVFVKDRVIFDDMLRC